MRYPGGKNGPGVAQIIINQIPPHRVYVEPFLGSGAVLRAKRPAENDIGIDLDWEALSGVRQALEAAGRQAQLVHQDALEWLAAYGWQGDEFVYCDPPYLGSVRSGPIYRHEFMSPEQHLRLLHLLKRLPCPVAISGYDSDLYRMRLSDWRVVRYPAMTRGGLVWESLWCNYPEPDRLHDVAFVGANRRKRQDLKRKKERWLMRLAKMEARERQAILTAIEEWTRAQA